jgi:hypothetical protein
MRKNVDDSKYAIGFGKPPEHSRFRKGCSGNVRGRPRGRLNLATILERVLQAKVAIDENGVCRTVTKLELALEKLVDLAVKGDLAALRLLTTLVASAVEQDVDTLTNRLAAADLEVLHGVLNEAAGRRLAETYLSRHGANLLENKNAE